MFQTTNQSSLTKSCCSLVFCNRQPSSRGSSSAATGLTLTKKSESGTMAAMADMGDIGDTRCVKSRVRRIELMFKGSLEPKAFHGQSVPTF